MKETLIEQPKKKHDDSPGVSLLSHETADHDGLFAPAMTDPEAPASFDALAQFNHDFSKIPLFPPEAEAATAETEVAPTEQLAGEAEADLPGPLAELDLEALLAPMLEEELAAPVAEEEALAAPVTEEAFAAPEAAVEEEEADPAAAVEEEVTPASALLGALAPLADGEKSPAEAAIEAAETAALEAKNDEKTAGLVIAPQAAAQLTEAPQDLLSIPEYIFDVQRKAVLAEVPAIMGEMFEADRKAGGSEEMRKLIEERDQEEEEDEQFHLLESLALVKMRESPGVKLVDEIKDAPEPEVEQLPGAAARFVKDATKGESSGGFHELTTSQVRDIMLDDVPSKKREEFNKKLDLYTKKLNETMRDFGISEPVRQAMFLATIAEESQGMATMEELLSKYASSKSKYKGRGLIQLTGQRNYQAASDYFKVGEASQTTDKKGKTTTHYDGFVKDPELAATPEHAFPIAGWFWTKNSVANKQAGATPADDLSDFRRASAAVNSGSPTGTVIGWGKRVQAYERALKALKIPVSDKLAQSIASQKDIKVLEALKKSK